MIKNILIIIPILISNLIFSQCNGRYQTEIFDSVYINSNVYYSNIYTDNEHQMDIYSPIEDTVTNRPVILYMHGGAFINGDKSDLDCVDFCKSFAKKGYVAVSVNYRLSNDPQSFGLYQQDQYTTVLKAVSDIKGAIRYFRKSVSSGNPYGIDENTIFIGGYSAGAVAAIHTAFIDDISDLPVSRSYVDFITGQMVSFNPQSLINTIGGSLEGDAGNFGFTSQINGVFSFAGGINDLDWIDSNDEPLVSCHGDLDQIVNYNCGPGLNIPTVFTLCGAAEMHPKANIEGIINDYVVFYEEEHEWCSDGNSNPLFVQAINFTSNFLFTLLPCNNITYINNFSEKKVLLKTIDLLGRKTDYQPGQLLIYIYSDGSVDYKISVKK